MGGGARPNGFPTFTGLDTRQVGFCFECCLWGLKRRASVRCGPIFLLSFFQLVLRMYFQVYMPARPPPCYYRSDLFDCVEGVKLEWPGKVLISYLRIAIDLAIIQPLVKHSLATQSHRAQAHFCRELFHDAQFPPFIKSLGRIIAMVRISPRISRDSFLLGWYAMLPQYTLYTCPF